ncbi:MAG: histidine phosphatase family protein [Abditibacteriaceae bacterium]
MRLEWSIEFAVYLIASNSSFILLQMRLYIIRHADPDYPNNTITPTGHIEAKALAKRMAKVGLSRIYTSPLGRAQDTACYTADAIGIEPVILPWTAELSIDGVTGIDGAKWAAWNLEGQIIRGQKEFPNHDNWHEQPELSHYDYHQCYEQLKKDSDAFLDGLGYERHNGVYNVRESNEERIAVFCHAGFGVSWMAHLLELPLTLAWCGFFWAPSSVTTILLERRTNGIAVPRALCVGDTSHIYAEELTESSRGTTANFN